MSSEIQSKPKTNPNVFVIGFAAITIGFASGYLFSSKVVEPCEECPPVSSCNTCYDSICNAPFDAIKADFAKEIVKNYHINHWSAINANCASITSPNNPNNNPPGTVVDSRAVWFSLYSLKRFIYEIEHKTCHFCEDSLELGVRIYFAEYPLTPSPYFEQDYAGMHTLMMVPTYYDVTKNQDVDFDPMYMAEGGCKPVQVDTATINIIALLPGGSDPKYTMRNHGGMIPPPYSPPPASVNYYNSGNNFMNIADNY